MFDNLSVIVADPEFRGCRYQAADLALADPEHPGHAVTREYREHVQALLERELVALGHREPGRAAGQRFLLINGAFASGGARPGPAPAALAREMAEHVLG